MRELTWDDVAEWFEPDGSLLDAYVLDANEDDWQRVIDLVRSQGWRFDLTAEGQPLPLPQQVTDIFARRRSEAAVTMHIWPAPHVMVNTHFFSEDEVEFDFDRTELQGQHQLDILCSFMRSLGRQLGKPVRLTPENSPQHPLIIYSPTDDQFTSTT
ncbi:hypothetical protein ACSNN7_04660 [Micromonospora sp. URMC 105]|uniref:hypothetical protein n=1 Tax=Micromonospora sp. URMC 105 TaxID=3423413 RepID=UPI003F1A0CAF